MILVLVALWGGSGLWLTVTSFRYRRHQRQLARAGRLALPPGAWR